MPPPKPPIPPAADANLSRVFDPWHAVGAGHQRQQTQAPAGWRESRAAKMNSQLVAGNSGGRRMHDTVGRGSLDFDAKRKVLIPREVRARAKCSVADMLRRQGPGRTSRTSTSSSKGSTPLLDSSESGRTPAPPEKKQDASGGLVAPDTGQDSPMDDGKAGDLEPQQKKKRGIFDKLVVYVNGSTHPVIPDHKLKHVLAENGARVSIHLGRRQVTHVILGRPASAGRGAGGGLAAGKLEKEIRRVGGSGIKYIGVEWVLESIKAGKRLPEARFSCLQIADRGQQSVYKTFAGTESAGSASSRRQDPHHTQLTTRPSDDDNDG